jgi:hypothetical protein
LGLLEIFKFDGARSVLWGGGGGYGFKLFTLELKIIDALQQIFFF